MLDVAAALEAEGLTGAVITAVTSNLDMTVTGMQNRINVAAVAMTTVGVPGPVQSRVIMRAFNVGIGGGGGAGGGGPVRRACPWCGGTGSHGGWCPGPYLTTWPPGPGP